MIQRRFDNWAALGGRAYNYAACSPNLDQLRAALTRRWRMQSLGCYQPRNVRGGSTISTHTFGAALDMGYAAEQRGIVVDEVIPYLIAWSEEWHLDAIHDYIGCRIWRAGRTLVEAEACDKWWKAQKPSKDGMGQSWAHWLHLETTIDGWNDETWEAERGIY